MGDKPSGLRSTLGDKANAEPAAYLTKLSRDELGGCPFTGQVVSGVKAA
jgi:hypothetical protein